MKWVESLRALEPPPELQEFNDARVGKYAGQLRAEGPNIYTQAAFDAEIQIVADMPAELRQVLVDEGCLRESAVAYGRVRLEAKARMAARGDAQHATTVEEYAQWCADVQLTAPRMSSFETSVTHSIDGLLAMTPPPGVEGYHDASLRLLLEWREKGEPVTESPHLQTLIEETEKLGPVFIDTLRRTGCISG